MDDRTANVGTDQPTRQMTKGEYRVGLDFNPSGNADVNAIKRAAADLIDYIESVPKPEHATDEQKAEIGRLKALAQTHIEDAAMWGVKAATKRPR